MENEKKDNILWQHPDVLAGSGKNSIPRTNPISNAGASMVLSVVVAAIIMLVANQPSTAATPVERAPEVMEATPVPVSAALKFRTFSYTYRFVCDGAPEYNSNVPIRVDYPVSGPEPSLTACRVAIAALYGDADQADNTPAAFVRTWMNKKEDTSQDCRLKCDAKNYVTFVVSGESLIGGNETFITPFTLDKGTGRTLVWTDIIPSASRYAFMKALAAHLPYAENERSHKLPDFDNEHMWNLFNTPVCLTPSGVVFYNDWVFGCHADRRNYVIPYAVARPHMSGYARRLAGI